MFSWSALKYVLNYWTKKHMSENTSILEIITIVNYLFLTPLLNLNRKPVFVDGIYSQENS